MTDTTEEVIIPTVDEPVIVPAPTQEDMEEAGVAEEATAPSADATEPAPEPVNEPVTTEAPAVDILGALRARMGTVSQKNKHLKMLVIGEPGVGKTTFSATAPGPLIVDVEKGTAALMGSPVVDPSKVIALEYKSFRQLEILIGALNEGEFPEAETIIIDSLSELAKRGMEEITLREYQASGGQRNQYVAETADHMENNEHLRRIASALRDLNRNIICISHPREQVDKATGLTIKRADFSERMAGTFNGIFDIVGMLTYDSDTGVREMRIQPTATIVVKTRVNGLPDVVQNPTWDVFYNAFQAQSNK